jgi:hypothetical protein
MHLIWLLLWFIAVCNPAPQPWYGLWIIALVALHPTRRRCALVVFGSTVAFCAYLAIGFVVPRL